ncbi:MAG TPA: type II secretion system F family protein [Anaerovoracaceae bacterium]|nr:type II secretion system F family protein [Anaerovoracaceae bacterium]
MAIVIAAFTFILLLLLLVPWAELFPKRYLHQTLSHIQAHRNTTIVNPSFPILNRLKKLLSFTVTLFRIDGYSPQWDKLRAVFYRAELQRSLSIDEFIAIKYVLACFVFLYLLLVNAANLTLIIGLLGVVTAFLAFFLPDQWLKIRMQKKLWEIQKEIPSVLISLAVTTDSGLSLFQAIDEVCTRRKGVLIDELKKTMHAIRVGIPQREAFEQLADRIHSEELTLFVSVIVQTLEKGSSGMTKVLREQSNEAWQKRKSKAKELGEKASIKLFLPLISLTLPALMIFLIAPAIFSILKFFM